MRDGTGAPAVPDACSSDETALSRHLWVAQVSIGSYPVNQGRVQTIITLEAANADATLVCCQPVPP